MTKMENFAGSGKVAHILKVWSLLITKSVENSSVMTHSPAASLVYANPAQIFFQSYNSLVILCLFDSLHRNLSKK
jgi:hypothetical protein